jgi:L-aminopeptidase/D-esterase-like protein
MSERPTGCTAILAEGGAVGGVDVRGGAPGTRETDLLDPVNTVQKVHAVVLSGGSAFGLDAASGVVRYLEERGTGFKVGSITVPIVVGAILFDLQVGDDPQIRPGPDCGYRANVGAGAGATVGKLAGFERAMKAGLGTASISLPDGLIVAALVAVNAVGDIVDPGTGRVIAGVRTADGAALADARLLMRSAGSDTASSGQNTTIGVVTTNARLTKAQATKIAQMAHDGLARAIVPSHTPLDGDTIFSLATGTHEGQPNVALIGALAAEAVSEAILRAAKAASGLPGLPAARDLPGPQ